MYFDYMLFTVGAIFIVIALGLLIYLLTSYKRSRVYAEVLRHETEMTDTLTSTLTSTITSSTAKLTSTAYTSTITGTATSSSMKSYPDITEDIEETAHQTGITEHLRIGRNISSTGYSVEGAFDPSVIAGTYSVEREIGGGNMSRTFEVRNVKLGNPWFLKFISSKDGRLANEENILKQLNHISLPKIIDVIHRDEGTYLIETLVEGVSLDKLLRKSLEINHFVLVDWFEQMAHVLHYLHSMKPSPILHLDLKPGNIMVTHGNRLVLVDFGISRSIEESGLGAITAKYAAPEQFGRSISGKHAQLAKMRFGDIAANVGSWRIDTRTDIYSLGAIMFELATGQPPTHLNHKILKEYVSHELCEIIQRCIAVNPSERYDSVATLQEDLRALKGSKIKMARILLGRKIATFAACLAIVLSAGSFLWGYTVFAVENAATLTLRPDVLTLSIQQSGTLEIERYMADGSPMQFDISRIIWDFPGDDIARIDGTRITGLNIGETFLSGRYRNREIGLHIRVVEPLYDMIEISQKFRLGRMVSIFAGSLSGQESIDGSLTAMDFFSPESIAATADGTLYITDAGIVRRLRGSSIETITLSPHYISAARIRSHDNSIYILTDPWQEDDGYFYAIARIDVNGNTDKLITLDAERTAVEDFIFSQDGTLYFIERNAGLDTVFLHSLTRGGTYLTAAVLPAGSSSLAKSEDDILYIGNAESGVIYVYYQEELRYFAGIEGERGFIDGFSARLYFPQRLQYNDGHLYVWDFNTLRRIEAFGPVAGDTITLAGMANPEYAHEPSDISVAAEDIVLPHGRMMDFIVTADGILLTDHKRGVVWLIT